MIEALIDPSDSPERQREKLLTIAQVLMRRVEQITDDSGAAYAQFQRAVLLEDQVRARTRELGHALDLLNNSNSRLAEAMREAESARQNLANAIETIQEGFALFDVGEKLVMCNSRFGMHMPDIRASLRPGISFADYVGLVSCSRFLSLPDGTTPDDWAVARMRRHQDRHVIFNVRMDADHWVQVSEHRTADGGTVILQTDVTEIIRTERHERGRLLDDQARMIRATLDHINQGVAIFDAGGHLGGWNRRLATLLALPASVTRVGVSFQTLFARLSEQLSFGGPVPVARDRLLAWVAAGPGRAPISFELRRGSELILDVFAQEMPDSGFVMSFTDVTAERAALAALSRANETLEARVAERTLELQDALADAERANASRSRFVAAASHDLLQPLSAAKLYISSIDDEALAPAARVALDKAQNALLSVEGLLAALLDISRLESGKAALSVGPVALDPLLRRLAEDFAPMAAAKGLRLITVPCQAVVESDPAYLRRILQNLISNAIRYTDRGRVLVGARHRGALIRLEVRDTGPGIPAEAQRDIFKEFHRLNARASASEGMGLGLAIVERACALLGHGLSLDSTPGRGTCFALELPLVAETPPEAVADASPPPRPTAQDKIALLVENDVELRAALVLTLERYGLTVIEAGSGEEALRLIDEIGILPDLILADHQLGEGRTGLSFLLDFRALHGPLPVWLITADRSRDLAGSARAAGMGLILKPIEPRELEQVLAHL
ncbi:PAS-domain containing protein [Xinfangfangia pollutisoli]|uniref:PAS-domain containing protein n=1 Tax=Xinfangfangia pollutisoli TaxID=2865960 RepID=UPI001CD44AA0|nr:PAS-domain containing protein [Xinfangfangia pollutisoli]